MLKICFMIVEIVNNGLVINGTPKGRVNLLALKNRAIEVRDSCVTVIPPYYTGVGMKKLCLKTT